MFEGLAADGHDLSVPELRDQFDDARRRQEGMTRQQLVDMARDRIYLNLLAENKNRDLLTRHNAVPHYGANLEPLDAVAELIEEVVNDVAQDPEIVRQALEVARGWQGEASQQERVIFVQRFKAATPKANRQQLRRLTQVLVHEVLHLREHDDYGAPTDLGLSEQAENTLNEGVVSRLTEIVWRYVDAKLASDPAERERVLRIVDGPYFRQGASRRWPDIEGMRYPSDAEVMRVVRQVGIRNLYAAYFRGASEMITGPDQGTRRSLLAPGGTAATREPVGSRPGTRPSSRPGTRPSSGFFGPGGGFGPGGPKPPPGGSGGAPFSFFGSALADEPESMLPPSAPLPPPRRPGPSSQQKKPTTDSQQKKPTTEKSVEVKLPTETTKPPVTQQPVTQQPVTQPKTPSKTQPPSRPAAPATKPLGQKPVDTSYPPSAQGRPSVHHIQGDLLRLPEHVGAIVNAAHNTILGGAGVSGAIQRAGGTRMEQEIRQIQAANPAGIATGSAVHTSAPNIKTQYVIHAVPPNFNVVRDTPTSRELLAQTYRSALALADSLGLSSVAFPVLSGSIFRGSLSAADVERIALDTLRQTDTRVRDVYLIDYQPNVIRVRLPHGAQLGPTPTIAPLSTAPGPALAPNHTLEEIEAPLLTVPFDAIVNPTDETLSSLEGISRDILSHGAPELENEIAANHPFGAELGEAVVTSAPNMGASHVIHVVVPDFRHGDQAANELALGDAYRNALTLADQLGLRTVAFPQLSAGDPRNGNVPLADLRRTIRATLESTPTTSVQQVWLVPPRGTTDTMPVLPRPTPTAARPSVQLRTRLASRLAARRPVPRPVIPGGAASRETLADLHRQRQARTAETVERDRLIASSYQQMLTRLGITPVDVAGDGDCFFHSIIKMYGDRLLPLTRNLSPTPARLRDWLADQVRADFALGAASRYAHYFPGVRTGSPQEQLRVQNWVVSRIRARGHWFSETGDAIPQIFADAAELPMTLVGLNLYHLGPQDQAPQNYIVYDGSHYRGGRATGPVMTFEQVRPIVDQLRADLAGPAPRPADDQTLLRHRDIYAEEFARLRDRFNEWLQDPAVGEVTDQRIITAANEATDAIEYFGNYFYAGLNQRIVDSLGAVIERLDGLIRRLTRQTHRQVAYNNPFAFLPGFGKK